MTSIWGMTGFGRADGSADGWTWSVEARSVNGRNLEVRFRGPTGFDTLERLTKAAGQARFARGQINVGLHARRDGAAASPVAVNEALLTRYLMLANQLAEEGATPPSADGLLSLRGVIEAADEDAHATARDVLEAAMARTIEEALDALKVSREREGEQLEPVLIDFIGRIEGLISAAEKEAGEQVEAIRDRFTRRIKELAPDAPGLDDRIFLEAAALATKADVRPDGSRRLREGACGPGASRSETRLPPAGVHARGEHLVLEIRYHRAHRNRP